MQSELLIPKKLHMIWVGDEAKRPDKWIQTWKDNHPDWDFRLWGNDELDHHTWRTRKQIEQFRAVGEWPGVADCMRYEILLEHGGVYADADSVSVRPLDNHLLEHKMFAPFSSEKFTPGLIANGYIGAIAGHPILDEMVADITTRHNVLRKWRWWPPKYKRVSAWLSVGPTLLTKYALKYPELIHVLASVHFIPNHYADTSGIKRSHDLIYARHFFGSTGGDHYGDETRADRF